MKIYLIRHGIAAERGSYANDEQRPLVNKGVTKTIKVAKHLLAKQITFDLILTSPLVRAYQTAEILKDVGLCSTVQTLLSLKPNGSIEDWLKWLQTHQAQHKYQNLALIGHQPDLSNWTEMLLLGTVKGQIIIKKSGVVGLSLPDSGTPIARSTLFLLSAPKLMI